MSKPKSIPRTPKACYPRNGKMVIDHNAAAESRVIYAEHDFNESRELCGEIAKELAAGKELPTAYRQWLSKCLMKVESGADANQAFGVKRKRGDRSLPLSEVRERLRCMAEAVVLRGASIDEAARYASEIFNREESVLKKLPSRYPDDWEYEKRDVIPRQERMKQVQKLMRQAEQHSALMENVRKIMEQAEKYSALMEQAEKYSAFMDALMEDKT